MLKRFTMFLLCTLFVITASGCNNSTINLSGTVESEQTDIFAEKQGRVIKLIKEEGATVSQGDVLLETDADAQGLLVQQAEALVDMKKSRLDELEKGTRPEQIKQAQAAVDAAMAQLNELETGSTQEQKQQALAQLEAAKAQLREANAGGRSEQVQQAAAALESADIAVKNANDNYTLLLDKLNKTKELLTSGAATQDAVNDAQNRADNAYNLLQTSISAKKQAQAQYDLVKNGATEYARQTAQANADRAQAQYDQVVKGATENVKRAATANVRQLKAQLELLQNGNTQQAIQMAQADVKQAQAQLEQARDSVKRYVVKAPLAGILLNRNVDLGELISPGTNIGTIADPNNLWVNLYIAQKDIGSIGLNKEITLKSAAISGNIRGKIVFISQKAEFTPKNIETNEAKENTVFRFKVKLLDNLDKLKPGMTISLSLPKGAAK